MEKGLVEFQRQNCGDCYFADKPVVGTGEPCCTYPSKLDHRNKDGKQPSGNDKLVCYSWKADAQTNARLQKARRLVNRAISRM